MLENKNSSRNITFIDWITSMLASRNKVVTFHQQLVHFKLIIMKKN